MCTTCGCDDGARVTVEGPGSHGHEHPHVHPHSHRVPLVGGGGPRRVQLERAVLAKNDLLAAQNRALLHARGVLSLNLLSSPGAGKTTLLERTIARMRAERPICVIEGDQETQVDAERIRAAGCAAVQVNTGTGCHLDASMVARALQTLEVPPRALLFIENVGNLVCPALFDLGETAKVVVVSTTEGEDKPLKYPHIFRAASLVLVNKVDLVPHLRFDLATLVGNARRVNPGVQVLELSATTGAGLDAWCEWLRTRKVQ